ncbi:MAG: class I SAM-dependent methyltransferase [Actinobacteria bacterium]|nr:class I SAM-dependent methyltransferase [Actinomycetota bacterium]
MDAFDYSKDFEEAIEHFHRGMEDWPNYRNYIEAHLGGPDSRVVNFANRLCPEIEYRCGRIRDRRVLDFGCGTGATTVALAQYSRHVCAFDVDEESVEVCRRRLREHGLESVAELYFADDLDEVKDSMGSFDLILVNGVLEHIPLTKTGLRGKVVRSLFNMLKRPGYLFITETPNRLWPFDFHSTQLLWIPWTRAGSEWSYKRAIKKGRHADAPRISKGPLGLEEVGAWGATYWEIMRYLRSEQFVCLNRVRGQDDHLDYSSPESWKRRLFDSLIFWFAVKLLHVPITAFAPSITNLVIKKV